MEFSCDYFELFGLPISYKVDLALLTKRYQELQFKFHPDRHMRWTPKEKNLAVINISFINQAYTELKSSLLRAKYLLSLQGKTDSNETQVIHDPLFLMEQMDLRERLASARKTSDAYAALEELNETASRRYKQIQELFEQQFNEKNYETASDSLAKMQFIDKFLNEINRFEQESDNLT